MILKQYFLLVLACSLLFSCSQNSITIEKSSDASAIEVVKEIASINKLYGDDYDAYIAQKHRLSYLKGKVTNYEISPNTDTSKLKQSISKIWSSETYRDYEFTEEGRVLRIIDGERVSNYGEWFVEGNQLKRSRWDEGSWAETIVFVNNDYLVLRDDNGAVTFYTRAR